MSRDYKMALEACSNLLNLNLTSKEKAILQLERTYLLRHAGAVEESLILLKKTISYIEFINERKLLVEAYTYLSVTYSILNLVQYQLSALEKLETLAKEFDIPIRLAMAYQHRGRISFKNKDYKQALKYYNDAEGLIEFPERNPLLQISLITVLIKLGNYKEAKLKINTSRNYPLSEYEEMCLLSLETEMFLYQGEIQRHKKNLKIVLNYFEETEEREDLIYNYDYLAEYYDSKGKYQEAAKYSKLWREIQK